jgi:molybdenum cofactor cytidylyltransferase
LELPTVIVLAAGRGERFLASGGSSHKLSAMLEGKTVLQHTLDAVRLSGLPWHLESGDHAGMGDSIASAVHTTSSAHGWLILPGDLPLVHSATLLAVAQALKRHEIVVPSYRKQRGHPVGFSATCLNALLQLTGDRGASGVVNAGASFEMEVNDPGCVTDIDTVEDLAKAQSLLRQLQRIN